jgi:hypothetical protein
MYGKSLEKVDNIDCKIIAFEVKKRALFIPYKIRLINFESSQLKTFTLHKVEAFDIIILGD